MYFTLFFCHAIFYCICHFCCRVLRFLVALRDRRESTRYRVQRVCRLLCLCSAYVLPAGGGDWGMVECFMFIVNFVFLFLWLLDGRRFLPSTRVLVRRTILSYRRGNVGRIFFFVETEGSRVRQNRLGSYTWNVGGERAVVTSATGVWQLRDIGRLLLYCTIML